MTPIVLSNGVDGGDAATVSVTDPAVGTAPPATRSADSEEQLHVGTEVQIGGARLRKFVVTEEQTVTVPVTREQVRVVREPLAPGEAGDDVTIGEAATDVTLTEERVVVDKETVQVEKVRLGTETITENRNVTEAVRQEQVEFEDGATPTAAADGTVPAQPRR